MLTLRGFGLSVVVLLAGPVVRGGTDVPFQYHRGEILLEARIDDTGPWTMMLDTGTDPSALDLRVTKEAGVTAKPAEGPVEGSGQGEVEVFEARVSRWQVGDLVARDVETAVLDLSPIGASLGHRLDGILGRSVLEGRVVQIDYPARRVRFLDTWPEEAPVDENTVVLPFEYVDSMILIALKVNGQVAKGLIDTGSNGVFKIAPAATQRLGLDAEAEAGARAESTGFRGKAVNRTGTVACVDVGAFRCENPSVVFFGAGMGHDDVVWDVNVGNRFLEQYVVTIDYPHRRLTLTRPAMPTVRDN